MKYILEFPIYSMSEKKYLVKQKTRIESEKKKSGLTKDNPNYNILIGLIEDHSCPNWKYNLIVGYLRLFVNDFTLWCDVWLIQQKKYNLSIAKKNFKYYYCYPKWLIHSLNKISSEQIYAFLRDRIPKCLNGIIKKKVYIDISLLDIMGKYINWKEFFVNNNR